jgi:hypothetical protein
MFLVVPIRARPVHPAHPVSSLLDPGSPSATRTIGCRKSAPASGEEAAPPRPTATHPRSSSVRSAHGLLPRPGAVDKPRSRPRRSFVKRTDLTPLTPSPGHNLPRPRRDEPNGTVFLTGSRSCRFGRILFILTILSTPSSIQEARARQGRSSAASPHRLRGKKQSHLVRPPLIRVHLPFAQLMTGSRAPAPS